MRRSPYMTRRTLLKALAAAGGGLATLPILSTGRLLANPEDVPLRILFVHNSTGILHDEWTPLAPGGGRASASAWELRELMSALEPYKDRMTMFKNLDMRSAKQDPTGASNAHINGTTHYMTATPRVPGQGSLAGGISIDQYIAKKLYERGVITRLPSLTTNRNLAIGLWHDSGQAVVGETDPVKLYKQAFEALNFSLEDLALREDTQSFVTKRYASTLGRLSAQDRLVIESHRSLRAQMFARIKHRNPSRDMFAMGAGEFAMLEQGWKEERGKGSVEEWKATLDLQREIIASAFHSDTTRVASLEIRSPPDEAYGYTRGNFTSRDGHDLEHKVSNPVDSLPEKYAKQSMAYMIYKERQRLQIDQIKRTLDLLDSVEETDGGKLLDHTLVVCTSHISNGSHSLLDLPWFVFGDAHGFFKTNHYVELERQPHPSKPDVSYGNPHSDLFVSLIMAMGVDPMERLHEDGSTTLDSFGDQETCNGPILAMHR